MVGRRSTRDIAIAAEAVALAHIEEDRADRKRIEGAFTEMAVERRAFHAESRTDLGDMRSEIAKLHQRLNELADKVGALPLRIIALIAVILTVLSGVEQLIWRGWPHL